MTRPPSIPANLWGAVPPNLRPAVAAVVVGLEDRIADLEVRLNQTSANSSRPPSADPRQAGLAPTFDRQDGTPTRAGFRSRCAPWLRVEVRPGVWLGVMYVRKPGGPEQAMFFAPAARR